MQTIKAIETHYQGYRFRSRTEARWAVFFDALGIAYQYEPEGFELPDGTRYLPDFWLPVLGYWIEIKPPVDGMNVSEKLSQLCKATGKRGFLLVGEPHPFVRGWNESYSSGPVMEDRHYLHEQDGWDNYYVWCVCPVCGLVDLQFEGRAARIRCQCIRNRLKPGEYDDRSHTYDDARLLKAYETARSARFEFGR
jgi:hypothetical protein